MILEQWIIFGTLLLTLILFITGRWRYDVVALLALLIVTLTGLIPVGQAFIGFSNPAIITVAAVLVLSRGLQNSGIVGIIGDWLALLKGGVVIQLAALTSFVALLSAFMNNVGALALLLPVVLQIARSKKIPASYLLMPLAFASLLGGMTTLIGTPPNIIASSFRESTGAVCDVRFFSRWCRCGGGRDSLHHLHRLAFDSRPQEQVKQRWFVRCRELCH
ncbi:MAG TPA: SLC13 family permease [Anaerolineales bacterium]|nr:SLC13 family permease [Anaerolineales bacterium]